jgi:hypothetical protein
MKEIGSLLADRCAYTSVALVIRSLYGDSSDPVTHTIALGATLVLCTIAIVLPGAMRAFKIE